MTYFTPTIFGATNTNKMTFKRSGHSVSGLGIHAFGKLSQLKTRLRNVLDLILGFFKPKESDYSDYSDCSATPVDFASTSAAFSDHSLSSEQSDRSESTLQPSADFKHGSSNMGASEPNSSEILKSLADPEPANKFTMSNVAVTEEYPQTANSDFYADSEPQSRPQSAASSDFSYESESDYYLYQDFTSHRQQRREKGRYQGRAQNKLQGKFQGKSQSRKCQPCATFVALGNHTVQVN